MSRIDKNIESRVETIRKNLEGRIENYHRQNYSGRIIREDLQTLIRFTRTLAFIAEIASDTIEDNLYTGQKPGDEEGSAKQLLFDEIMKLCDELGIDPREL